MIHKMLKCLNVTCVLCTSKSFYNISKSTYDFKYFVMKGISYVDKLTSVELLISSIFASSLWALQAETPRSSRVPGIVLSKINPNDPEINIPFFSMEEKFKC